MRAECVPGPDSSWLYAALADFRVFVASGLCWIKDRSGSVVPLELNRTQKRLLDGMTQQAYDGLPVRIRILKARKRGVSTFVQALFAYLCSHRAEFSARTVAHTDDSTTDIHEIAQRAARRLAGELSPKSDGNPIAWANGSSITTRTAGGRHVLSGANINAAHCSEVAKWPGERDSVMAQLASINNGVPHTPESIIIEESTANMMDPAGQIWRERYEAAAAGSESWLAIFSPWFEDDDTAVSVTEPLVHDDAERDLVERFGLTDAQLQYRREKLEDFGGHVIWWNQEYPATVEEAFQRPSGLVFPMLAERHAYSEPAESMLGRGYEVWRAIDFGAVDPFVCLFVLHHWRPGDAASLSIDRNACPNTWRELRSYHWDRNGRPADQDDHTCDALRYAMMHFSLPGHVHVFGEIYEPLSARSGLTILDMLDKVKARTTWPVRGTVCDRSQPGTIALMNLHGLAAAANRVPEKVSARGEKLDGIIRMQIAMNAEHPLRLKPPEPSKDDLHERLRRGGLVAVGVPLPEVAAEQRQQMGLDPYFGSY